MSACEIEAGLEAELAAIGSVAASYEAVGLDGDGLSSDDSQDANPLSLLGGFDEFALCVRQVDEVKDRAAVVVAESEFLLGSAGWSNNEHCIGADESEGASTEKSVIHAPPSLSSSATSDEVSDESDVPSIGDSAATLSAKEPETTIDNRDSSMRPPTSDQSNEYDEELRAIEQEAIEAELARQERSRRAQIIRETALVEATKAFEQQTGAAIALQAMVRQTVAKQRVKQMRRALQVEAHLVSVHNKVSLRRAMSTVQSHSRTLRKEAFQIARARLQLHLIDRRERYNASAIIIQCCFRQYIALRLLARRKEAAVILQRFLRCKQSKGNFRRLQTCAIVVQRNIRARVAEKEAAARKIVESVTCIQQAARGFLARRGFWEVRKSALTLQRCYRGQRARIQLTSIQCSSFAFDEDSEMIIESVEDLIGGIEDLDDEHDDAFLEGRQPPRRRGKTADVVIASNTGTSTPEANQIDATRSLSAITTKTAGGWGARVARAFSERGQNMLPGTRRRKNNNRSRREGQSRWR